MISKELLSEVLKENITYIELKGDTNYVQAGFKNSEIVYVGKLQKRKKINIYELAHKCKEWAFKRKFDFEIIRIKHGKDYGKIFVRIHTIHTNRVNGKEFYPFEEEPEAIFKACEWILKENNGNK